jgi:two-component system, NarL family, sensor kinase
MCNNEPQSDTEKLEQRNRELSILNTIAEALNREVDLTRALESTLAHAAELFSLRTSWIWLLNEETGESYLAASQHLPPVLANNPRRMEGWCHCIDTYESGDMSGATNVNIITCTRLKNLIDGTDGLRYHASIPLFAHSKPLGILNVASSDWSELSDNDLKLLYTVGDLLSIAIERARLFARSQQLGAVEERNRLAREIHDTLAQGLAATAMQIETADALLEGNADPQRVRQTLQHALDMVRGNLEEARRSVMDLRAAPLEGRTLAEALPTLARDVGEKAGLHVESEIVGAQRPLAMRIEAGLFRIAQEAISNVIRHAQAKRLIVELVATPEAVRLVVEDDGLGFDPDQVPRGRFGLIGINERAHLLGGTAELCSSPGTGTRLEVRVPLDGASK